MISPAGLPCVSPTERDDQDQTMRRNLSTPELRAYWQRVEAIAANSPIVRERLGVPEYVPSDDPQPVRAGYPALPPVHRPGTSDFLSIQTDFDGNDLG